MTSKSLNGKCALITGSTSGIGLALAEAFAQRGCAIVLNGFGEASAIERTRSEMAARHGVGVRYAAADMSKPAEIRRMILEAGPIDILINNAGVQFVAAVEEFPEERWDQIMAINLSSNFHTIRAVIPGMRARGWGRIINIASVHGLVASPFKSAYVAAKHGVVGLTKTVALELAETAITCNAICPGYVHTPLVDAQITQQASAHDLPRENVIRDVILASQPNKKFISTEAITELALFMCQPAAGTMTGSVIPIDGGWTAR